LLREWPAFRFSAAKLTVFCEMAFQNRKVSVKVAAALGKFNRRPRRVEGRCRAVEGAFGTCKGGGAAV
jgi:hypothetical protein